MATQEYRDSLFIPSDYRTNFKAIIAKRSDLVRFDAGRMAPAAAGLTVTYLAGLVLGLAATGANAGFYVPYASGNTDGSQVAVGVLSEDVLTDSSGNGSECSIIKAGVLFKDYLIGLDAGAITALNGKASVEHGTNLIAIYA
jgi:hypothetical protein